ncbi:MAG: MFS transporter [Nanoarchaeota archaeon]|nr:MFS transporter [DPANN group archaeon]MBL7116928.1 MFS transporter [Nanoarchaeota archaeon]
MYIAQVLGGLLFFLPIIALYLEEHLFSVTNVAIVFLVESFAMAIFEVPTGAIADLFGRKKTIILSNVVVLLGFMFLYIGGSMIMFIFFALFNALARSLFSGTSNAMIYDTLKEEGKAHHYKKIIGTYSALWSFGAVAGSLIGGYLASFSLSLTVIMSFIPFTIMLLIFLFLKEPKYETEHHKNVAKHMFLSSKEVVKNYQLIIIFVAGLMMWGIGESMHRLSSLFYDFKQIPIIYFGIIYAFTFGLSSIGHYYAHDVSERLGDKNTLVFASLGTFILLLLATFTTGYVSVVLFVAPSIFFGLRNPIVDHMINEEVESKKRATVISIYNLMTRIGMIIFLPFVGYLTELYTINTAFKIGAVAMITVPVIFMFLKEKSD